MPAKTLPGKRRTKAAAGPAVETVAEAVAAPSKVLAYKGFNADLMCRDHKFTVGQSYEVTGEIEACKNGFHACEYPLAVFDYYPPANNRFAVVELEGDMDVQGDKTCARKITITRELTIKQVAEAAVAYTIARAKPEGASATGYQGASSATGDQGASSATGYQGASSATGYQGASSATGTRGASSATGYQGASSATGYQGASSATGKASSAMATGFGGKVLGAEGCALFLVERVDNFGADDHGNIKAVWSGIAGRDGIKPNTFYTIVDGKPVEVA